MDSPPTHILTDNQVAQPMDVFDAVFGHCRPTSIVGLGSRRASRSQAEPFPHWLCPVPVKERGELLPGLFEFQLDQTQYYLANTLSPAALTKGHMQQYQDAFKHGQPKFFEARNQHIFELTAIIIDLDVGRDDNDISAELAIGAAMDRCRRQHLPWPAFAAMSGRGAYLLWALTGEDGDVQPPLNTDDNRQVRALCVRELLNRTEELKSDPNAVKLANWYKRPGTIDTSTGNEVVYMTFGMNRPADIPRYSLSDMAKFLNVYHASMPVALESGLPLQITDNPESRPIKRRRVKRGKGGEPHKKRMDEIELISQHRGGIKPGARAVCLFHYFRLARSFSKVHHSGKSNAPVLEAARRHTALLNETFDPPISDSELEKICKPYKEHPTNEDVNKCRVRNATICDALSVTLDEVNTLELESIIPAHLAAARRTEKDRCKAANETEKNQIDSAIKCGLKDAAIAARFNTSVSRVNYRRKRLKTRGELPESPEPQRPLFDDQEYIC